MREITDEQEIADLHIQALGQQNQTEEPEPHAIFWIAIISTTADKLATVMPDDWFLVSRDSLGTDQAWQFKTATEAMDALESLQSVFRTWLENRHS